MAGFSIDTHLLRELGELLVGRDSTAVIELIKNAYDADATSVVLEGIDLGKSSAVLRVTDDGHGMSIDRFRSAFLRIAGRDKEGVDRRSPIYSRAYTGQKGIGRLATHKLAAWLGVTSVPVARADGTPVQGVRAELDWDEIEKQLDLHDLTSGLDVQPLDARSHLASGTTIEMRRLRSRWSSRQLALFITEVRSAQPPGGIIDLSAPGTAPIESPLLEEISLRDANENDPGFQLQLQGDLETGDDLWQELSEDFEWMVEIDATTDDVIYQITPLREYASRTPEARTYRFQRKVSSQLSPRFQARFFTIYRASTRRGPLAGFVRANTGIRVYLEGFRVLPYGEYGDDWLGIDREIRTGARYYTIDIDKEKSDQIELDRREALMATANSGYIGAVFLTENTKGGLRSLVNREGFVPDEAFESLVELVRTGVNLSVRVRRSVFNQVKERERVEQLATMTGSSDTELADEDQKRSVFGGEGESRRTRDDAHGHDGPRSTPNTVELLQPDTLSANIRTAISNAQEAVTTIRSVSGVDVSADTISAVADGFTVVETELSRLQSMQTDLRILASVGLQLGAFVHDINGMLGQAGVVRDLLEPLVADATLTAPQRRRVRQVSTGLTELVHTLARQSAYLTDVLMTDPRRRRSRIRLTDRVDTVIRFVADQAARLDVAIENTVSSELKTPPMFPAEVGVLLTNLLTNAVKNAGSPGRVVIVGERLGARGVTVSVHNTGRAVDLADAERWFLPFESTTVEVNDVLGQGLGLGLPITRALVEDYKGRISFVQPPSGFATSIRVELPDPQERR